MFRRQKILLGILLEAPKIPTRTELMKWAFLVKQETSLSAERSFYAFVPYKYGPFSFTLYKDLSDLARLGYLNGSGNKLAPVLRQETRRIFKSLPLNIQEETTNIVHQYCRLSQRSLRKRVYERYPWFATRNTQPKAIKICREGRKAVYTAGYEGDSIDLFFQKLLKADIERIIDVRSNPVSRKYGFSKPTLQKLCEKLEMDYVHLPELGIPSSYRRSLKSYKDYQKLLREYDRSILPKASKICEKASHLMVERPSAIFCFESDIRYCHRGCLARVISSHTGMEIIHL